MDIGWVLRSLNRPARLPVSSTASLAAEVYTRAKEAKAETSSIVYLKAPSPVEVDPILHTRPADILRELSVATTFLTDSPFVPVARHWAHVRYCATLDSPCGQLRLSKNAAEAVVHHHKVAQSEQLGIGLALVVARAVLAKKYPRWHFDAVDADVALKAGFIDDVSDDVRNEPGTKKRPDYFLIGRHRADGRAGLRVVVLECKGTHGPPGDVIKQLGDACLQVGTVAVGNHPLYGLMIASRLTERRIESFALDPPGDVELWSGEDEAYAQLLTEPPAQEQWARNETHPVTTLTQQSPQPGPGETRGTGTVPEVLEEPAQVPPPPYNIPEDRKRWLAQVLSRTTAASVLMFAGDRSAAAGYGTLRQIGQPDDALPFPLEWADTIGRKIRMPGGGPVLEGTTYSMPIADGRRLEVFRGVERRLHRRLADGDLRGYLNNASRLRRWWTARRRPPPGDVFSVGEDGTAMIIRLLDK